MFLAAKRIRDITLTNEFDKAVDNVSNEVLGELQLLIKNVDSVIFKKKIKKLTRRKLEDKTVGELRLLARREGVKDWNSLPKNTLISILKKRLEYDR
jgi:hypothetical protein